MKKLITFLILVFTFGIIVYFWINKNTPIQNDASIRVTDILADSANEGFARAMTPIKFEFPRDLGAHPEFRSEWWYFTGNLKTEDDRLFGYQFTIFRNAINPDSIDRQSDWSANQIYMAHLALTDVKNQKFYFFERFNRGAQKLTGAQASPLEIWLDDWRVEQIAAQIQYEFPAVSLIASDENISLRLNLTAAKPVVFQGDKGLSQKGQEPGNASYYYSFTRLKTKGNISVDDQQFAVQGNSWLDREWSTSALGKNQVGWDWFSLQLDDGREIMYYQIRNADGSLSKFSSGTFVEKNGTSRRIDFTEVKLTVLDYWQSPFGDLYPAKWTMKIQEENVELTIIPNIANQELNVSIRYWEGSVSFRGTSNGKFISGLGYVEMTGYENVEK